MKNQTPQKRIVLTKSTIEIFPKFLQLLSENKIIFDKRGKLRYLHGAPVGDMILVRINKNGQAIYRESADEWFDPKSPRAEEFKWPVQ